MVFCHLHKSNRGVGTACPCHPAVLQAASLLAKRIGRVCTDLLFCTAGVFAVALLGMGHALGWYGNAASPPSPAHAAVVVGLYLLRTFGVNATEALRDGVLMDYAPKEQRARWASLPGLPPRCLKPQKRTRRAVAIEAQAYLPVPLLSYSCLVSNAATFCLCVVSRHVRRSPRSLDAITSFGWSGSAAVGGLLIERHGFHAVSRPGLTACTLMPAAAVPHNPVCRPSFSRVPENSLGSLQLTPTGGFVGVVPARCVTPASPPTRDGRWE